MLAERQEGRIEIVLLLEVKRNFHPELTTAIIVVKTKNF